MIFGEVTAEKITANDFIKQVRFTDGSAAVVFCNSEGKHIFYVPCADVEVMIDCTDKLQTIFAEALAKHVGNIGSELRVIDDFHKLFYSKGKIELEANVPEAYTDAYYLGIRTQKNPLDLWVYQEILWETKPDLIIECGTAEGGTTLYLANILDLIGWGKIVSIDAVNCSRPTHPRIEYITGDTLDPAIAQSVWLRAKTRNFGRVMVILDDDHGCDHVIEELKWYGPMVTKGQYLIVEDTNINGHPVLTGFGAGPYEAVEQYMAMRSDEFVVDKSREKFLITQNPNGYLRRIK